MIYLRLNAHIFYKFINGDDMYFGNDRMELVRKKIIEETNENE